MAGEPQIHKTFLLNALGLQIAASAFIIRDLDYIKFGMLF